MRTLTGIPLFGMFTSYVEGSELMPGNLPAAYDDFVGLLTNLPQDGDTVGQLRRLNYTRIELSFMRQTSDVLKEKRHVLDPYVFIDKVLSLLDAEIEMLKECLRHYTDDAGMGMDKIRPQGCKRKSALRWNGTDSDLIELVAALMAAGVGRDCAEGRELTSGGCHPGIRGRLPYRRSTRSYTKRGKVFDRCTDTTPFIDSLRKSYNQDARRAAGVRIVTPTAANGRLASHAVLRTRRTGSVFFAV